MTTINSNAFNQPADHAAQAQPDRHHRQRTYKAALISYQNGFMTCDATLKNKTDSGALLQIDNKQAVPDSFLLSIPVDGISINSEVRWRKGNLLGVNFVGEPELDRRNARKQSVSVSNMVKSKPSLRKDR